MGQLVAKGKPYSKSLPCELTDREFEEYASMLARTDEEEQKLLAEHKQKKEAMKNAEAAVKAERSRLSVIVNNRKEDRPQKVQELHDFDKGQVFLVRLDTMDVVKSRDMHPGEQQAELSDAQADSAFVEAIERHLFEEVAER